MNLRSAVGSAQRPSLLELFTPKLITVLREGYTLGHLRADAMAGLTVAIVALPLSMALAIASGASPAQGLYTAIFGGFCVSALGGSRFQIGGPAAAFVGLVAATIHTHGMEGLALATMLAGVMLVAVGLFQLGTYIKFIPYPVKVGFTAGIAAIIFVSQIRDLLGLRAAAPESGAMLEKLRNVAHDMPTLDLKTAALSVATVLTIVALRRFRPHWPGALIAVAGAALAVWLFQLPVETIATRFGGIPSGLPAPSIPMITPTRLLEILPNAISFALLGSIESLLSAVIADGMTGRRHRSNCELVAQGIANIATGIFGGICVTGTIARTATNVRSGAHGPISGMLHSLFLLLFVLVAAPAAGFIPLASLAGILVVVAWHMIEKQALATLLKAWRGEAAVSLATFLLTILRDLTEAIVIGVALGSIVFIARMSRMTAIETHTPFVPEDSADSAHGGRTPYDEGSASDPNLVVYRISGAFFFGAAGSIGAVLDRISDTHQALIVDFAAVPFIDSTAANTIEGLAHQAKRRGVILALTGASREVRSDLFAHGIRPPLVRYEQSIEVALTNLRQNQRQDRPDGPRRVGPPA
jgi:sulfate permease, SulP family